MCWFTLPLRTLGRSLNFKGKACLQSTPSVLEVNFAKKRNAEEKKKRESD